MKKALFLFLIILSFGLYAQTGTIDDNQTYIQVNYASGDTVAVAKDQVVHVKVTSGTVYLMGSNQWSNDPVTKIIALKPSDFGYSTATELRDYLAKACFRSYTVNYSYDAGGNVDTVKYYIGSDLQFSIAYGYTDGNVTSKTAPF